MGTIGIGCNVVRKDDGSIERVLDLNGRKSILFRDALALVKDESKALSVWATAYTSDFIHKYGWTATKKEPELHVVLDYIQRNKTGRFQMSKQSVSALTSLMSDSGLHVQRIRQILSKNFIEGGKVVVTKERMIHSGIYSLDEAENTDSYEMIGDTIRDILNSNVSDIFFIPDSKPEYSIPDESGVVDALGRALSIRGDVVYQELLRSLVDVKDNAGIEVVLESFKYSAFVEVYRANKDIQDEVKYIVSNKSKSLSEVNSMDDVQDGYTRWSSSILVGSDSDLIKLNSILNDTIDVLTMQKGGDSYASLRKAELELAKRGIDIVGLSEYLSVVPINNILDIFSGLLVYSSNHLSERGADSLEKAYRGIDDLRKMSSKKDVVLSVRSSENLFTSDKFISPRDAFEKGFIKVEVLDDGRGLYTKRVDIEKESAYQALFENIDGYNDVIQKSRWGKSIKEVFSKYAQKGVAEDLSFEDFSEDMDKALQKDSSYDMPKGLILDSIILFIDPSVSTSMPIKNEVAISKLYSMVNPDVLMAYNFVDIDGMVRDLNRRILIEGAKRSSSYDNFWQHVSIDENGLSIGKDGLVNLNMISNAEINTLRILAARLPNTSSNVVNALSYGYSGVSDISSTKEFKRAVYYSNPYLISNAYKGGIVPIYENFTLAQNEYADFIRVDDSVYEKVSENNEGGVYVKLDGTNPSISFLNMEIEKNKKENFVRSFSKTNPINKMLKKDSKVNVRC